jgi:apolipoprotein N-acyltransferase
MRSRTVAAFVAGLLVAAGFPPIGWWPAAVAGTALLTGICVGRRGREGAWLGLVAGLGCFGLLLQWMRVVGIDAWLGLTLLQASFWVLLGAGLAVTSRLRGWPLWAAGGWVLTETLRATVPWGGFPWGRLAHLTVDTPVVGTVAVAGPAGATALVAALGVLLAAAVVAAHRGLLRRAALAGVLAALLVLAGVAATALLVAPRVVDPAADPTRAVPVALVQGNVPDVGLDFLGRPREVLENHVEATQALAADVAAGTVPAPTFVVWPENSSDLDPSRDAAAAALIDEAVAEIGVQTLVGALIATPDGTQVENSAIVWDPVDGPVDRYVKRHPVPFGEYVPGREFLTPIIGRLALVPRDFVRGTEPGLLTLGGIDVGVVICFEIAYDPETRDVVRGGARALVVQTNNATYGRTGQPQQQFAIARLRAVEHGLPVLVAATSGISGIIAADGTVVVETEEFVAATLVEEVLLAPPGGVRSTAALLGPWVEAALATLGVLGLVLGALVGRGRLPWLALPPQASEGRR